MSSLFVDTDAEVVKLTLTKRDNSGTVEYQLGRRYYPANQLYGTNPIIYPLLAESPRVRRGVGVIAGIKYDVTIPVFAKTDFTERGTSFADLLQLYELHNATVELRYYPVTRDGTTTHSDANNIRQVLKCTDLDYSEGGGILNIVCRDVWFKDKEVSKRLTTDVFTDMDVKYDGEYGSIVFGEATTASNGIAIDAPIISSLINGFKPELKVFSGFTFADHPNNAFKRLLAKHQHKRFDQSEWLVLDLLADPQNVYAGNADGTGGSASSLAANWRGIAYSPENGKAIICNGIVVELGDTGTIASGDGDAVLDVFFGELAGASNVWTPYGSPIRTAKIAGDNALWSIVSNFTVGFQIIPPLVMSKDEDYFIRISWTNTTDTTNYIHTRIVSAGGYTHFRQDKSENERTWIAVSDERLPLAIWSVGDGNDAWEDSTTSGTVRYSYYHLEGTDDGFQSQSAGLEELNRALDFKIGISGIEDDGSGTYTGSAAAIIQNASDLIRFTTMSSGFGLGLTSASVDTSDLGTVRSSLSALGITHKIVINRETTAQDFILELARQSRTVFYKKRSGKLSLKFPTAINNTFTVALAEAYHRGEFVLDEVRDNDYSSVVNAFNQFYKPEELNQPPVDPATLRRAEREKLAGKLEMDASSSTSGDTYRQAICSTSQAKYGRREMTAALDYFDTAASAQIIQNYYVDRYSTLQRRAKFRIPRKRYYTTLDLFDNVRLSHSGIDSGGGTALLAKQHSSSSAVTAYNEGVPLVTWLGGSFEGQIYQVEEEGPWLTFTAETVSQF